MKLFGPLYEKVLQWAKHPRSTYFLTGMSFAESSFFPIPPDVMLAPMCLARPQRAWFFAFITTLASTVGGVFGYFIGVFAFDVIEPILHDYGYWDRYTLAKNWFDQWGIWVVFLAGFTPIPYKVFTIAAGVANMALLPFIVMSFLGRGARFFLVAGFIRWGGARIENLLRKYVERIGWGVLILAVVIYLIYHVVNNG